MSVRSFHSVFMATAVAGAALGCYLVSLRVASERAALQQVENQIVQAHRDIRLLQTEIGTRARLAQLERWNVRVLSLSAPSADQILGDKFQLARLVRPEEKTLEAPVILAAAPAPEPKQPFAGSVAPSSPGAEGLLHQASVKIAAREQLPRESAVAEPTDEATAKAPTAPIKKTGEKKAKPASREVTAPIQTAKLDPLAPLPETPESKASRTQR